MTTTDECCSPVIAPLKRLRARDVLSCSELDLARLKPSTFRPVTNFDPHIAYALLDSAHRAWCARDLTTLVNCYDDDLVYTCNVGPAGAPLTIGGKPAFHAMLSSIVAVADSMSVIETFRVRDGVAHARISSFVRHRATNLTLSGKYRQIVTFLGSSICRVEEFHDAARLSAFWRLVAAESEILQPLPMT